MRYLLMLEVFLTFLRTSSINLAASPSCNGHVREEPSRHFPPCSQIAALAADCLPKVPITRNRGYRS
jgi:hypothetical protein